MSSIQEIELPPDPERVIVGLRDTGYEFDTAVADIVDNSLPQTPPRSNSGSPPICAATSG